MAGEDQVAETLNKLAPVVARRMGLTTEQAEDIRQRAAVAVFTQMRKNEALADRLQSARTRCAYVRKALSSAGLNLLRDGRARRESALPAEVPCLESSTPTSLELEDLARSVAHVRERLGQHGKFVFEIVVLAGISPAQYASLRGLSAKSVRRWSAIGSTALCDSITRILGGEYGSNAVAVFKTAISAIRQAFDHENATKIVRLKEFPMCENLFDVLRSVRGYRIGKGELAYRNAFGRLSEPARRVVFLMEEGASAADIVTALGWKYHEGTGRQLAPNERRAAAVEFANLVSDICEAFEL